MSAVCQRTERPTDQRGVVDLEPGRIERLAEDPIDELQWHGSARVAVAEIDSIDRWRPGGAACRAAPRLACSYRRIVQMALGSRRTGCLVVPTVEPR